VQSIRAQMLLTGSRTVEEFRRAPKVVGPDLQRWIP
jgi:isopentenyl diphosphate isomerase/L-lactate dehydrogenase-like FMN-dependent dehydrogenase